MTRIEAFEAALRAADHINHPLAHAHAVAEAWRTFLPMTTERQNTHPQAQHKKILTGAKA